MVVVKVPNPDSMGQFDWQDPEAVSGDLIGKKRCEIQGCPKMPKTCLDGNFPSGSDAENNIAFGVFKYCPCVLSQASIVVDPPQENVGVE